MGPVACFDKSFLQSLSLDESVWFDHFFVALVTPLFFVETLADLEKCVDEGYTPESEVGKIADKTPEQGGAPNVFHLTLCNYELRGFGVPMEGRPVLGGGKPSIVDNRKGWVFEVSAEAEAFERWRRREFLEVERLHAKAWRTALAAPMANVGNDFLHSGHARLDDCKELGQVLALARSIVDGKAAPYDLMKFIFAVVGLHSDGDRIFARYKAAGFPPIRQFAPYTAHVLDVEIFSRFGIDRGFFAPPPATHRIDLAYLNYLPFCRVFVSKDKLHRRTVPLFKEEFQDFVWGEELKTDLMRINELHADVPEETRVKGLHSFAPYPPTGGDFLTARLWDRMNNRWRTPMKIDLNSPQLKKLSRNRKRCDPGRLRDCALRRSVSTMPIRSSSTVGRG